MTAKVWGNLLEVTRLNRQGSDRVLLEHLAEAVTALNLPSAFVERMQAAVAVAIRRAWQHDPEGVVAVTLAALVQDVGGGRDAQNWGFFLIEKRVDQTRNRRIDVLLYPEAS